MGVFKDIQLQLCFFYCNVFEKLFKVLHSYRCTMFMFYDIGILVSPNFWI